jgi:hypothetical protein
LSSRYLAIMFSLVWYGPLWPCSLQGRSRARVLDIPPRHFLADFKDSAHSRDATGWAQHPSHNVANTRWQYAVSIPRKQLRPAYGEGFQGAPLDCGTHTEGGVGGVG